MTECIYCGEWHAESLVCTSREDYEERAAILEHDAGLTREAAEEKARDLCKRPKT